MITFRVEKRGIGDDFRRQRTVTLGRYTCTLDDEWDLKDTAKSLKAFAEYIIREETE